METTFYTHEKKWKSSTAPLLSVHRRFIWNGRLPVIYQSIDRIITQLLYYKNKHSKFVVVAVVVVVAIVIADTIVQLFSVSTVHELSIVFDGAQHKIESPCVCVPLVYTVFQEEEESLRQRGREKAKENEKSANELVKQYRTIIMMTKKKLFHFIIIIIVITIIMMTSI